MSGKGVFRFEAKIEAKISSASGNPESCGGIPFGFTGLNGLFGALAAAFGVELGLPAGQPPQQGGDF
jgi:hypothetical protein